MSCLDCQRLLTFGEPPGFSASLNNAHTLSCFLVMMMCRAACHSAYMTFIRCLVLKIQIGFGWLVGKISTYYHVFLLAHLSLVLYQWLVGKILQFCKRLKILQDL